MRTKGLLSIIMLLGLLFTVQAADHVDVYKRQVQAFPTAGLLPDGQKRSGR